MRYQEEEINFSPPVPKTPLSEVVNAERLDLGVTYVLKPYKSMLSRKYVPTRNSRSV